MSEERDVQEDRIIVHGTVHIPGDVENLVLQGMAAEMEGRNLYKNGKIVGTIRSAKAKDGDIYIDCELFPEKKGEKRSTDASPIFGTFDIERLALDDTVNK